MISFPLKIVQGEKKDILVTLKVEKSIASFTTQPYTPALMEKIKDFMDMVVSELNKNYEKEFRHEDECVYCEPLVTGGDVRCALEKQYNTLISSKKFWDFLFEIFKLGERKKGIKIFDNIQEIRNISFAYDEQIKIEEELRNESKVETTSKFSLVGLFNLFKRNKVKTSQGQEGDSAVGKTSEVDLLSLFRKDRNYKCPRSKIEEVATSPKPRQD